MTAEGRRRWVLVGVAVIATLGMGLAWWLLPGPPDLEDVLTPDPASVDVPELPPPDTDRDPQGDETDDDGLGEDTAGGEVGVDGGAERALLTDPDTEGPPTTEDGLPISMPRPKAWVNDAIAPTEGRVVGLAVSAEAVLVELQSNQGSFVQILRPDQTERRGVRLDGVAQGAQAAARARSPVAGSAGFVLLADDRNGDAVWTVDLETATATVLARPQPEQELSRLRAEEGTLGMIGDQRRVLTLEDGRWQTRSEGPGGLVGLDIGGGPTVVTEERGQIWVKPPNRTVAERIGAGREPVRLSYGTAFVRGGAVLYARDGEAPQQVGTAVSLPGADLAVASDWLFWIRPDGNIGRWDERRGNKTDALLTFLINVNALAVATTPEGLRIAVAGRVQQIQEVDVRNFPGR